MKIYIPNDQGDQIGGGWTFNRNIKKALRDKVEFVSKWEDCDIYFITGATMAQREEVQAAKDAGKVIILRVDNALKNSRNRNTGMTRLYDFARLADKVIYQSKWARGYLSEYLNKSGPVILNGCDQDIFKPEGPKVRKEEKKIYLYTRFNRDETKGWHEAWYEYQEISKRVPNTQLWLVGKFSSENAQYNFDFFNNEDYEYKGVVTDPEYMAMIYRSVDYMFYPYFNDACSNTLIEARSCGCKIQMTPSGDSGGAPEILNQPIDQLGLDRMGEKYMRVFSEVHCE